MEGQQDRSDVPGRVSAVQQQSYILDILQFIEDFGGCAIEDAVAVVNSECNDGMDHGWVSEIDEELNGQR